MKDLTYQHSPSITDSYILLSQKSVPEFAEWLIQINKGYGYSPPIHFFHDSYYDLLENLRIRFLSDTIIQLDESCKKLMLKFNEALFEIFNTAENPLKENFEFYDAIISYLFKNEILDKFDIENKYLDFINLGSGKKNICFKLSRYRKLLEPNESLELSDEEIFDIATSKYKM
jgi:hypothetical protein